MATAVFEVTKTVPRVTSFDGKPALVSEEQKPYEQTVQPDGTLVLTAEFNVPAGFPVGKVTARLVSVTPDPTPPSDKEVGHDAMVKAIQEYLKNPMLEVFAVRSVLTSILARSDA